ncbi:protein NOV [Cynoglossus semilaevis]|uniref:CCN family member 3 n=1 Tax=Cynoglossus semilaevis TaxID=244447 RepID=A0A3P8UVN4_CYNSE|nr:protein NOV homolog [Cynoglossus semilaevis]XP_024917133.1 protein NOV homolog [Cynoglossus semilaevis]XP_024917134.1 protein NOV homolog [Cynoglossus semilaevis]
MSSSSRMVVFLTFLTAQVFASVLSQACPRRCQCPKEPPVCVPGVPLILDDCACCLVCARQKGQVCSELNPCDTRKGLQCDYKADVHKRTGVCAAHKGQVCVLDGSVYQDGQVFFPSCKYQCVCRDGQIGCLPRCNLDVMLPGPDCPMPRKVQVPGECCEKWVCEPQAEASALGGFAMAAYRQEETVSFDTWDPSLNCVEQTTEWGACSQTCGMGVSTRVTNKNRRCEMVKQSRLCMIRPCEGLQEQLQETQTSTKRGTKCQRIVRTNDAIHLAYKNCTSVQAYKTRYCGSCIDGRCCTPHRTKTAMVEFQCTNGKTIRRPVMVILTCACHSNCPQDNAVWQLSELEYTGMTV